MALEVIERHQTPDGMFTFLVGRTEDGDYCLGFDGYSAHTHADILASLTGLPEQRAMRQHVDSLLGDKSVIGISRIGGQIQDVWTEDAFSKDAAAPPGATVEYRYWSGAPAI